MAAPIRTKTGSGKDREKRSGARKQRERRNLVPGFHAVKEALETGHEKFQEIWIAEGKTSSRIEEIRRLAAAKKVPVYFKQKQYLSDSFKDISHQSIAGVIKEFDYFDFPRMLRQVLSSGTNALLLAADHITDPGNLGALMRAAAFFGSDGLIIPKDRSARITPAAIKRASGTHTRLPVARVTNLGRSLEELSTNGLWIVGAAGDASKSIYAFDWNRPLVLVLGSEQKGISPSIRKKCHQLVSIPSPGGVESLNISVAGGVVLSEIFRQRNPLAHLNR